MVVVLLAVSSGASWLALRDFRAAGARPLFYQSNFEPAVMMACGRGFGVVQPAPPELTQFLNVERDTFDCAAVADQSARPLVTAAHANWYYLYGAAAGVWRITGVSWEALDWLVAAMAGVVAATLYGLFRLVASRGAAAILTLVLVLSPANLTVMLSLRDYSKAPFVLGALFILAVLILRPLERGATWALAAAYGALVAVGYGFRGDLAVMAPIGVVVVLAFLPGALKTHVLRNVVAALALAASFVVVGWPVLNALKLGGCQYHFALLGLTSPLTSELRLEPSIYRFGDHLTDTFVDLKVGDYAMRVLGQPPPSLCNADYDVASGDLYMNLATTFPADLVARAYGSVLGILRVGLAIPEMMQPMPPFPSTPWIGGAYRPVSRVTTLLAPAGPVLMLIAVGIAWAQSVRLGLAMTVLVLFLGGYPAIQFEARHWFHLRFLPWFAAAAVVTSALAWRRQSPGWPAVLRGAAGVIGVVIALGAALAVIRAVQRQTALTLISQYESMATTPVPTGEAVGAFVPVMWNARETGSEVEQRASDLLVVTLNTGACGGAGPLALRVRYDADVPSHDLSNDIVLARPRTDAAPTRVFIPVFRAAFQRRVYLQFSGLEVAGAPASCIGSVATAARDAGTPLWLQVRLPADWRDHALYESMRAPRFLQR